jgi:hypothetical protein
MPVYREQIDEKPDNYVFLLINGEVPSNNYKFIRLDITEVGGSIIYNEADVKKVSFDKIFVVGYTQEKEEEEKSKLGKLIK